MERRSPLRVAAIAGDPGGASALAPVIRALVEDSRFEVLPLAYRHAVDLWRRRELPVREVDESISVREAAELLRSYGAEALLAATSVNDVELEKRFLAAARETQAAASQDEWSSSSFSSSVSNPKALRDRGRERRRGRVGACIPSLAVLDYWSNYARRFSEVAGDLRYVPDRIAVMDEQARTEMVAEGFDPERLVVTGQPAFDDLAAWRAAFTPERRGALRSSAGIGRDELLVLFASQPLSRGYGAEWEQRSHPGYDEKGVVPLLLAALERIAERTGRRITLALRPHPREDPGWFETLGSRRIRVRVLTGGESREWVMAADLVTGMSTVLLVEACLMGCLTVSLQPGLRLPEALPTNRQGISRPVYTAAEIEPALVEMLLDDPARRAAEDRLAGFKVESAATPRIVDLMVRMIGRDPC